MFTLNGAAAKNRKYKMSNRNSDSAFVEFERVQKSYDGENLVVKDLNLSMPKGEFLTMLGPSGSGKTTCLMMLAGFETATTADRSTTFRRTSAASEWCSRTTRCFRI